MQDVCEMQGTCKIQYKRLDTIYLDTTVCTTDKRSADRDQIQVAKGTILL